MTQEDVDQFYDDLENMEVDESAYDENSVQEFEQEPITRLLEQYKRINIALRQAQEASLQIDDDGGNDNGDNELAAEQLKHDKLRMADFLRERLLRLIEKSEIDTPEKASPNLTDQENEDVRNLWELFREEMEKK